MSDKEKIDKLKLLLKELFQFDNSDLDFGIYRVINIKRKEISDFIDKELFDIINEKIKTLGDNSELKKAIDSLRAEIEESFGCNIEEAKAKYAETPKVKNYIDKEKELKTTEKENELEDEIYDDIINFFSRYYDKGDFISKRRYSKDNKYAIPYNGEEVYLYWANNDQYYIKMSEIFKGYSFNIGNLKVNFEIVSEEVEIEKGNIKDSENKFFIFHDADYDATKKLVSTLFGYRGLTDEEVKAILDLTQKKSPGKDEVNAYNLKKINEKIALFGLSDLQKKHTKMDGEKSDKSELEWHLNKYTTKNTTDYFIHKNLKRFLSQELDFFIKNEILHIENVDSDNEFDMNLDKIKVIKAICLKIIEFLSQVEDFQKMLWDKKKFVISTDYCITLDYVPEFFYSKILENNAQLEEWTKLYSFDIEKEAGLLKGKLTGQGKSDNERKIEVLKQKPTLTIDTKFYDNDFKYQLLSEIDDLDEKTNGILIKSDNFHALSLLMNNYGGRIKCCYVDPPYNTGGDGFIYKDNFQNSSWLSMVENRIAFTKELSHEEGLLFISIDDNEQANLKQILNQIFSKENFIAQLIWKKKSGGGNAARFFADDHEYILSYAKNKSILNPFFVSLNEKDKEKYRMKDEYINERGPFLIKNLTQEGSLDERPNLRYEILDPEGKPFLKSDGRYPQWRVEKRQFERLLNEGRIYFNKVENKGKYFYTANTKQYLYDTIDDEGNPILRKKKPRTIIDFVITGNSKKEMGELFGIRDHQDLLFTYAKPKDLIVHLIDIGSEKNSIILDSFAGSGTTGHAVLSLNKEDGGNRKFILVEMGDYFDTVLTPRIQKVVYSDQWEDGKPLNNNGSKKQIIKYQTLEQYEDSLNNIDFIEPNVIAKDSKDYKIKYMLEFESKGSKVLLNIDALDNPFDYKLKFEENNELKEKNIDLVETFNYLAGINVKSIRKMTNEPITYVVVKGYCNEKDVIVIWRNKPDGFDPIRDKEFIEKEILKDEYDEILVNGNSLVKGAKSIDEIFKANMFGGS